MFRKLMKLLPHITIVISCMFLIFWYLDELNPTMNFVNCSISNKLLLVFCVAAITTSIGAVWLERKID